LVSIGVRITVLTVPEYLTEVTEKVALMVSFQQRPIQIFEKLPVGSLYLNISNSVSVVVDGLIQTESEIHKHTFGSVRGTP
jgi:hypothetical protein